MSEDRRDVRRSAAISVASAVGPPELRERLTDGYVLQVLTGEDPDDPYERVPPPFPRKATPFRAAVRDAHLFVRRRIGSLPIGELATLAAQAGLRFWTTATKEIGWQGGFHSFGPGKDLSPRVVLAALGPRVNELAAFVADEERQTEEHYERLKERFRQHGWRPKPATDE